MRSPTCSDGARRLTGEVEQDEALDDREADGLQAVAGRVEVLELVGERRVLERAVEAVGPRVVGALEARDAALGLVDDARAAVAAAVEERARDAGVVGDDHDAARRRSRPSRTGRARGPDRCGRRRPELFGRSVSSSHSRTAGSVNAAGGSCVARSSGSSVRSRSSAIRGRLARPITGLLLVCSAVGDANVPETLCIWQQSQTSRNSAPFRVHNEFTGR